MKTIFCMECGTAIDASARFCPNCGKPIQNVPQESSPTSEEQSNNNFSKDLINKYITQPRETPQPQQYQNNIVKKTQQSINSLQDTTSTQSNSTEELLSKLNSNQSSPSPSSEQDPSNLIQGLLNKSQSIPEERNNTKPEPPKNNLEKEEYPDLDSLFEDVQPTTSDDTPSSPQTINEPVSSSENNNPSPFSPPPEIQPEETSENATLSIAALLGKAPPKNESYTQLHTNNDSESARKKQKSPKELNQGFMAGMNADEMADYEKRNKTSNVDFDENEGSSEKTTTTRQRSYSSSQGRKPGTNKTSRQKSKAELYLNKPKRIHDIEQELAVPDPDDPDYDGFYENVKPLDWDDLHKGKGGGNGIQIDPQKALIIGGIIVGMIICVFALIYIIQNM